MALVITKTKRNNVSGSKITAYLQVTFDNSYSQGGESFDVNAHSGLGKVDEVRMTDAGPIDSNFVFAYDSTNKKIVAYGSTTEASGALVDAGAAAVAGGKALLELPDTSALLDGYKLDIAVSGSR